MSAKPPQKTTESAEDLSQPHPLSSTMVAEASWEEGEMTVLFQSGSEETYDATQSQFEELLHAPSPGKWMWQHFAPHPL